MIEDQSILARISSRFLSDLEEVFFALTARTGIERYEPFWSKNLPSVNLNFGIVIYSKFVNFVGESCLSLVLETPPPAVLGSMENVFFLIPRELPLQK